MKSESKTPQQGKEPEKALKPFGIEMLDEIAHTSEVIGAACHTEFSNLTTSGGDEITSYADDDPCGGS